MIIIKKGTILNNQNFMEFQHMVSMKQKTYHLGFSTEVKDGFIFISLSALSKVEEKIATIAKHYSMKRYYG